LKLLTGAKLITEIATTPHLVRLADRPRPTFWDRVSHEYFDFCLYLVALMSDCLHLLSPDQLSAYRWLPKVAGAVFHEYVPVSSIDRQPVPDSETFILLVGAPWYLKGADLLIEAFRKLSPDFPGVKLRLLGHYPDREELEALTGGSPQIEIMRAKHHPETLRLIGQAAVLVLPSRCEGMGRVLIEAMAAGVPVIESDIGGIPFIIRNGENGFLFPRGDSHALEARLRQLLGDADLRRRLGDRGYQRAHSELNEQGWVNGFADMVETTINQTKR
jgi:glycosyltransferase involved in cell wall biosynthesis